MDDSHTSASPSAEVNSPSVNMGELIEKHQVVLWRYLRVLGCEPSLADDLTQETFLAVLTKPFEDYGDQSTLKYLRTVARNLLISRHRRESRCKLQAQIDHVDLIWDRWTGDDKDDLPLVALRECFNKLREKAQTALNLRFRERKTRKEIAEAVNMSEHGAKNLMQRAKRALRDCVERRIK
ncbi:MAG: sigma-70 family RNA polymerase sigma factor [Pirellulales bacterium]|nr:sigma-70 family RNA polymerase sigma factor [Pirellulales bacterium]